MRYSVGDKVLITDASSLCNRYGVAHDIAKYAGKTMTIREIFNDRYYTVESGYKDYSSNKRPGWNFCDRDIVNRIGNKEVF